VNQQTIAATIFESSQNEGGSHENTLKEGFERNHNKQPHKIQEELMSGSTVTDTTTYE